METREVLAEIYKNLDRMKLLSNLNPVAKEDYVALDCPLCGGEGEAYIYYNGHKIYCNRGNSCGKSINLWDYVAIKHGISSNKEILGMLAQYANYPLTIMTNIVDAESIGIDRTRGFLLEEAQTYFKNMLFSAEGDAELEYLRGRGYTDEEIQRANLGCYHSQQDLKAFLINKGDFTLAEVEQCSLFSNACLGRTNTLTIPHRDHTGRLQGFIVRTVLPSEEISARGVPKYCNTKGLPISEEFFNMERNNRKEELVITEGYLDSLIISARGSGIINNKNRGIVATGKASISAKQLDHAIKYGTKRFIFALDMDTAGQTGVSKSIDLVMKKGLSAYVCSLPDGYKDPDEFVQKEGIGAFEAALYHVESGAAWKAKELLQKHGVPLLDNNAEIQVLTRDRVVAEALTYEQTIVDSLTRNDFIQAMCSGLNISADQLECQRAKFREKHKAEAQKQQMNQMLKKAQALIAEDNFTEAVSLFANAKRIENKASIQIIEPYTLDNLNHDVRNMKEGLKTGMKALDDAVTIPQGALTIVAGRTSHGKTTLLLNLLVKMVQRYPDKRFYFFSYEENCLKLALKILMILSQEELDQYKNYEALALYFKLYQTGNEKIEAARLLFDELTRSQRLNLISTPFKVSDLTSVVNNIAEQHENVGAIFIDYIQKIKNDGAFNSRQLNIQNTSAELLESANSTGIPMILGAQFGRVDKSDSREKILRLDNIREAGDIEQDANLVIGIWNEAMVGKEEGKHEMNKITKLELHILKNREGEIRRTPIQLSFNRPVLALSDRTYEDNMETFSCNRKRNK